MGFVGTIVSIVVGGAVAAVTVIGLVNNTVDSGPSDPGSVESSQIQYGS